MTSERRLERHLTHQGDTLALAGFDYARSNSALTSGTPSVLQAEGQRSSDMTTV